jgi:glyoxylase-like metal-dependent hydrolase (beta-lactamase superfamily II)
MREVHPGIFMITERGALGAFKPPVNLYVMPGPDGIIYDGGYGDARSVRFFVREFGSLRERCAGSIEFRITRILLSHAHPDHFSGLGALRRELGIPVAMTAKAASLVATRQSYRSSYERAGSLFGDVADSPVKYVLGRLTSPVVNWYYRRLFGIDFLPDPDIIIEERGPIMINGEEWRVFPSPGHSDDHISLYHPGRGVLFSGDNVLRTVTPWLGPPKSDIMKYISSLEEMLGLPRLELVLGAHGSPVTAPRDRIRELIAWRRRRIEDTRAALAARGRKGASVKDLLVALYPGEGRIKRMMAEGWVVLTIEHLVREGKAVQQGGSPSRFRAV